MNNFLKQTLWKQFSGSIDMLKNAILFCSDEWLQANKRFYYITFHALLFLDYYLTIPPNNFSSALPFTIKDADELPAEALDDIIPDKIYSKQELFDYLQTIREKCEILISGLTEEKLQQRWIEKPDAIAASSVMQFSVFEILLYNMRHVQHHAGQLYILLRQQLNNAPLWV